MGRRSHARSLRVWANGRLVGEWRLPARGATEFRYDAAWCGSPEGRPLSLSLPLTPDNSPLSGAVVQNYFDNLLPESGRIRARLQSRFRTPSQDAFDLLEAIGRDCVGAVQLLPDGVVPDDPGRIQAEALDEAGVERLLLGVVAPPTRYADEDEDFRISIAGAQEKTALTWHDGAWCRPRGSTPTTHIFKLPMRLVGNRQADRRTSVENEWLCAQLLRAFGLPIAACEIQRFGEQKVLVVERFDRRLSADGRAWLRLPQEDFCQATGTPAHAKYQADGGPGLGDIARILHASEDREQDLGTLLKAQFLFWLLAATDGHAKNFSIFLLAGGRFRLTPLYDVLSAWPVTGPGPNHLDADKLRLAMALRGKNAHYRLRDIQRRDFDATARQCGWVQDMDTVIDEIVENLPEVIDRIGQNLPAGYPPDVFDAVTEGMRGAIRRLGAL